MANSWSVSLSLFFLSQSRWVFEICILCAIDNVVVGVKSRRTVPERD